MDPHRSRVSQVASDNLELGKPRRTFAAARKSTSRLRPLPPTNRSSKTAPGPRESGLSASGCLIRARESLECWGSGLLLLKRKLVCKAHRTDANPKRLAEMWHWTAHEVALRATGLWLLGTLVIAVASGFFAKQQNRKVNSGPCLPLLFYRVGLQTLLGRLASLFMLQNLPVSPIIMFGQLQCVQPCL